MGKILEVKNLTVHIKTHKGVVQAVRGVDFYLNEQETLAVVGESGSGKSITMKGVMGILPKNGKVVEGSVMFQGNDLTKYSERQMQQDALNIHKSYPSDFPFTNGNFRCGILASKL